MHIPRLLLAAPRSGEGKTSVTAALMAALTAQGVRVFPYKVGPDYIDPAFHRHVTGRPSRNLDSWLLSETTLLRSFLAPFCNASGREALQAVAVIEGVMGLFDGQGLQHRGSTAHVAEILQAPVLLIVNGKGMSRSVGALVSGYARFDPRTPVAGVIFNRLAGEKHYRLLQQAVQEYAGLPCFGFLPENPDFHLPGRHLGLIPPEESIGVEQRLASLAEAAREHIDIQGLSDLARAAVPIDFPAPAEAEETARADAAQLLSGRIAPTEIGPFASPPPAGIDPADLIHDTTRIPPARHITHLHSGHGAGHIEPLRSAGRTGPATVRIGLARDAAFSFYYQDSLDLLVALGAELVPFSPLRDAGLPPRLDGLYLGGGFPDVFASQLEANTTFRAALRDALEQGLPAYAECGGMLYLTEALTAASGATHAMTGFLPCRCRMISGLRNFGYVTVTTRCASPLGPAGLSYRAHEFHYSEIDPASLPVAPKESPDRTLSRVPDQTPALSLSRAPGQAQGQVPVRISGPASDPPADVPEDAAVRCPVCSMQKPDGRTWEGGMLRKNVFAVYPHLHFCSSPEAAAAFLAFCRERGRPGAFHRSP